MWHRVLCMLCLLSFPLGTPAFADSPAVARRPNIVIIMADDMGFSDVGCYGSEIATPHIDRLAERGLRFTQFYNTTRCCPTRASLLTGLYSHQAGIGHMVQDRGIPSYSGGLNRDCVTIAEVLRPAGYRTLLAGKWHVTPLSDSKANWPLQRGVERYFGILYSIRSFFDPPTLTRDNTPIEAGDGFHLTDAINDQAVAWIEEYGRRDEPFLLYVAHAAPHWPLHAPPEDIAKYRDTYRDGWDVLRQRRHRRQIELGVVDSRWPLTPRDTEAPAWDDAEHKEWQQERMAVYAAMIEQLDRGVGRILSKLRETGQEENTLVLFLSDNGGCAEELEADLHSRHFVEKTRDGRPAKVGNNPAVLPGPDDVFQSYGLPWANASNTPFRLYKHWVHEGGIATPLIAHWPAVIRQPSITHQPGHVIDLMATCLDVAGVKYPEQYNGRRIIPLEGKSLFPIFEGKTRPEHEALFWEHEGNRAVRQGTWKLVARHDEPWELYDLEADRTELTNLSERHPEKVRQLTALYDRWAARAGVVPWDDLPPLPERPR